MRNITFMPFGKREFCVPPKLKVEECFVFRIPDDTLLSAGLKRGLYAVVKPLSHGETYRDGEICVVSFGGRHLLKSVRATPTGSIFIEDATGIAGPFPQHQVKVEARFVHACTGAPRCTGPVSREFSEPVWYNAGRYELAELIAQIAH